MIFEAEFSYAEATKSFDQFPLYDQLDDDTINQYRRNLAYFDFRNSPPTGTSPRFYYAAHPFDSIGVLMTVDTIHEHTQFGEGLAAGLLGRAR